MKEAWKFSYSCKNFSQINIDNSRKLNHFICNIHDLYVTFLALTEGAIERCFFNSFS